MKKQSLRAIRPPATHSRGGAFDGHITNKAGEYAAKVEKVDGVPSDHLLSVVDTKIKLPAPEAVQMASDITGVTVHNWIKDADRWTKTFKPEARPAGCVAETLDVVIRLTVEDPLDESTLRAIVEATHVSLDIIMCMAGWVGDMCRTKEREKEKFA